MHCEVHTFRPQSSQRVVGVQNIIAQRPADNVWPLPPHRHAVIRKYKRKERTVLVTRTRARGGVANQSNQICVSRA